MNCSDLYGFRTLDEARLHAQRWIRILDKEKPTAPITRQAAAVTPSKTRWQH